MKKSVIAVAIAIAVFNQTYAAKYPLEVTEGGGAQLENFDIGTVNGDIHFADVKTDNTRGGVKNINISVAGDTNAQDIKGLTFNGVPARGIVSVNSFIYSLNVTLKNTKEDVFNPTALYIGDGKQLTIGEVNINSVVGVDRETTNKDLKIAHNGLYAESGAVVDLVGPVYINTSLPADLRQILNFRMMIWMQSVML